MGDPPKKQRSTLRYPYVSFSPRLSRDSLTVWSSKISPFSSFPILSSLHPFLVYFTFRFRFHRAIGGVQPRRFYNSTKFRVQDSQFHSLFLLLFFPKICFLASYDHSSICFAPIPASDHSFTNMVFFSSENFILCFFCPNSCSIIRSCSCCLRIRRHPLLIL